MLWTLHHTKGCKGTLYTRDVERDRQNALQNSLLLGDLRHLLVDDVDAESVAGALELGDDVADGLDALHLLVEVVALQEVAEVGVALLPRLPVQVQQRLIHRLLELEGGLHASRGLPHSMVVGLAMSWNLTLHRGWTDIPSVSYRARAP